MTAPTPTRCPVAAPARRRAEPSWWRQWLPGRWRPLAQLLDVLSSCHQDAHDAADASSGEVRRRRIREATAEAVSDPAGRWTPTPGELRWAAQRAWRDEPRCIGRWRWQGLATVRDRRHLTDPDDLADDLAAHLREATRNGQIKPVVTILNSGVAIANEQLIGYAGYRFANGDILGDPRHTAITDLALHAGWGSGGHRPTLADWEQRSAFDLLPLLFTTASGPEQPRYVRPVFRDVVCEVPLTHPEHDWFAGLGLRWYAVPALTSHQLVLTDTVTYPVVISGHYLSTEIACRDLADTDRYNVLPDIAKQLGLDTTSPRTGWQARAELVLHEAVITSFDAAGVRISDPISEADRYQHWVEREHAAGRTVREDWSWTVPPHAPARTAVYRRYLPPPVPFLPAYRPRSTP